MRRSLLRLAPLFAALSSPPLSAQVELGAYALGVGSYAGESDLGSAGSTLLARGRVMASAAFDALVLDAAYEHIVTRSPDGATFAIKAGGGQVVTGDWLGTDWTIASSAQTEWRHRFDRLSLGLSSGPLDVTVGRQGA